jgi:hypothetical protein
MGSLIKAVGKFFSRSFWLSWAGKLAVKGARMGVTGQGNWRQRKGGPDELFLTTPLKTGGSAFWAF